MPRAARNYVVVGPTGFLPYFLYAWEDDGAHVHWLPRRDLARRFTAQEAHRVANRLNAASPGAVHRVYVEKVEVG